MADLAILVGGTALALGLWRLSWDDLSSYYVFPLRRHDLAYRIVLATAPASIGFALAFLAIRIVPPRPRWRVIFRQPGTSACLAIVGQILAVVLTFSWHVFLVPRIDTPLYRAYLNGFNYYNYLEANRESGAWVAVAWVTLALTRAWRPEPSWIDRAGRVLGVFAIVHWLGSALIW